MDLGQYLLGGTHPPQDRGGEPHTQRRQQHTNHQTKGDAGVDGLAHRLVIFGTEIPGNDHTGAHRQSAEEADHHKNQAAGGTHRRQSIFTDVVAYAPGVEGVIKLLEQIAQKDRQSKQEHAFPDAALGQRQLLIHTVTLLSVALDNRFYRKNTP